MEIRCLSNSLLWLCRRWSCFSFLILNWPYLVASVSRHCSVYVIYFYKMHFSAAFQLQCQHFLLLSGTLIHITDNHLYLFVATSSVLITTIDLSFLKKKYLQEISLQERVIIPQHKPQPKLNMESQIFPNVVRVSEIYILSEHFQRFDDLCSE